MTEDLKQYGLKLEQLGQAMQNPHAPINELVKLCREVDLTLEFRVSGGAVPISHPPGANTPEALPKAPPGRDVWVPRELTAENGAKAALLGSFNITLPMACTCGGDRQCPQCSGKGEYLRLVNVPWTTIKRIYAAAVEHFEFANDVSTRYNP